MENIEIKHIKKSYTIESTEMIIDHAKHPTRTLDVLRDLSLNFPVGHITVIVGRSGCGKSTLLRMLEGREAPDSGEVLMPKGYRTALLSPNPYVITWTSVLRNVAMAAGVGHSPEERMELSKEYVHIVGLDNYSDLTPIELSTGMKQRLGLARILASQCQVLLMDEPFASLDFITRAELQGELLRIQKKMPRTIILVTHQLQEAVLLAEKIVVMHSDSTVKEYDLSHLSYPRDLESDDLRKLQEDITRECRK